MKYSSILNTKTDIRNLIANNHPIAENERMIKKILESLKGEKIEQPKKNFLKVKDLSLEDIDPNKMELTQ